MKRILCSLRVIIVFKRQRGNDEGGQEWRKHFLFLVSVPFWHFLYSYSQAEQTARMKAEMKERTFKTFLLSQKHIVYTEPLNIQAGSAVTVFYNPANTVLNGKSEIWFRCSFNRWTHRMGALPPQKMLPVENSSHVKISGEYQHSVGYYYSWNCVRFCMYS